MASGVVGLLVAQTGQAHVQSIIEVLLAIVAFEQKRALMLRKITSLRNGIHERRFFTLAQLAVMCDGNSSDARFPESN